MVGASWPHHARDLLQHWQEIARWIACTVGAPHPIEGIIRERQIQHVAFLESDLIVDWQGHDSISGVGEQSCRNIQTGDAALRPDRFSQQWSLEADPASKVEAAASRRQLQGRNDRAQGRLAERICLFEIPYLGVEVRCFIGYGCHLPILTVAASPC